MGGDFSPITSEFGFLQCDYEDAARAYVDWLRPIQAERNVSMATQHIIGDLSAKIRSLLPLTSVEVRRAIFLPTRGSWTAFLDNGWRGTDSYSTISHLCQVLKCSGIRAAYSQDTIRETSQGERGQYGATIFELYSPTGEDCSFLNTRRSVCVMNDGGRWVFEANGEPPLQFEETEKYKSRRIQDRFTPDMLERYLRIYGIEFFSSSFYDVTSPAILVSKEGPRNPKVKEYSLEDARKD